MASGRSKKTVADSEESGSSTSKKSATETGSSLHTLVTDVVNETSPQLIADEVTRQLGHIPPQEIEIILRVGKQETRTKKPRQHYLFPAIAKLMTAKDNRGRPIPVALVGPAGTGKTTVAVNVASALGRKFVLQPFTSQTPASTLTGYMDANGQYVKSPFYNAFADGHVFIGDEFDRGTARVTTVTNSAISNGVVTFPNGETITAHQNFAAIVTQNTYGTGAVGGYVGASQQDASVLDRFVFLWIPLDEGLEASLVGVLDVPSPKCDLKEGGRFSDVREILDLIHRFRKIVEKREIMNFEVGQRTTLFAVAMHKAGFGKRWILECALQRYMPLEQWKNISAELSK